MGGHAMYLYNGTKLVAVLFPVHFLVPPEGNLPLKKKQKPQLHTGLIFLLASIHHNSRFNFLIRCCQPRTICICVKLVFVYPNVQCLTFIYGKPHFSFVAKMNHFAIPSFCFLLG